MHEFVGSQSSLQDKFCGNSRVIAKKSNEIQQFRQQSKLDSYCERVTKPIHNAKKRELVKVSGFNHTLLIRKIPDDGYIIWDCYFYVFGK